MYPVVGCWAFDKSSDAWDFVDRLQADRNLIVRTRDIHTDITYFAKPIIDWEVN